MLDRLKGWAKAVEVSQRIDTDITYPDGSRFQEHGVQTLTLQKPIGRTEREMLAGTVIMTASTLVMILNNDSSVIEGASQIGELVGFLYLMKGLSKVGRETRQFVEDQLRDRPFARRVRSTAEIQIDRTMRGRHAPGCS
jgi:hypothetical protein